MSCNFDCTSLGNHEIIECGNYKKGGIPTIGLLECNYAITDFTSGAQWTTEYNAGRLKFIRSITAEVPDPSPVEVDNPVACGAVTILDTFDRTVTWMDANVTEANIDWYNKVNKRKYYLVLYHCDDASVEVILNPVSFVAFKFTPKTNRELRQYKVTAKWTAFDEAQIYELDNTGVTLWSADS